MKDKKGVLGLEVAKPVMLSILILAVIAVALFLTVVSLRDVTDKIDTVTFSFTNKTTATVVNETGAYVSGTSTLRGCVITITSAINRTGKAKVNTTDFASSGCLVQYDGATAVHYNNTLWNITGSITYPANNTNYIVRNITTGTTGFFSNTGTIFSILVVVIIISAIAIVISVVSGIGGGAGVSREGGVGTLSGL